MPQTISNTSNLTGTQAENDMNDYDLTGDISFTDDIGDIHSVTTGNDTTTAPGGSFIGSFQAGLSNSATADGAGTITWDFVVTDPAHLAIIQGLADGESISQTYTVLLSDNNGESTPNPVTITITGTNDVPVFTSGPVTTALSEGNVGLTDSGTLDLTDVDVTDIVSATSALTTTSGTGSANLTPAQSGALDGFMSVNTGPIINGTSTTGTINYSFNSGTEAFDFLGANETLILEYTITAMDDSGTLTDSATQTVTITITGTNDIPIIAGTATGAVIEDSNLSVANQITIADADAGESTFVPIMAGTAGLSGLGTFEVDALGNWTYTLDNANPAVQALADGETTTDTIVVNSFDGTTPTTLTVTINGTNDAPVIVGGSTIDIVTETDMGLTESGSFTVNDVDLLDTVTAVSTVNAVFYNDAGGNPVLNPLSTADIASFMTVNSPVIDDASVTGTLNWEFDSDTEAFDFLGAGETLEIRYRLFVSDDAASGALQDGRNVTITITGTNDAAVITGDTASMNLVETGVDNAGGVVGTATFNGNLDHTDVDNDNADDAWTAVASTNTTYGTFAMDALGVWSYTIDNGNSDVDALNVNQSVSETINVTTADGTPQAITITINGTNDAPTLAAVTGTVNDTAAADAFPNLSGMLDGADVDNDDATELTYAVAGGSTTVTLTDGALINPVTYGVLTVNPNGSYSFDPAEAAIDALAGGAMVILTTNVQVSDGSAVPTTAPFTITINGANDAPVAVAQGFKGAVVEDTGPFTITDTIEFYDAEIADGGTHTVTITPASTVGSVAVGDYVGTLSGGSIIATSGGAQSEGGAPGSIQWTYSVSNADTQFLAEGETILQTYQVVITDGNGGTFTDNIEITLTGTNDAPDITSAAATVALAETDAGLTTGGSFAVVDVDVTDIVTVSSALTDTSGTGAANVDPALAALLDGFMSTGPAPVIDGMADSGTINYAFNSGSEAFDFLAQGETLVLEYTITASDDSGTMTSSDSQTVTITITGTNDAPVISSAATASAAENQTVVSTVTVDDADAGATQAYSIVNNGGADDGALFTINAAGELSFIAAPDFENDLSVASGNSYVVEVMVDDGTGAANATTTQTITVTVTDANDAPVFTNGVTDAFTVNENQSAVATVVATDEDLNTVTFTISGGADAALFQVDPASGVLSFINDPDFENPGDADTDGIYDVEVTATDTGNPALTATQAIAVTVADVNDAPVITSPASVTVGENQTAVLTVTATDQDLDNLNFTITGGADSGLFTINATTGELTFVSSPDFENPADAGLDNVYDVQVTVTDDGTGTLTDVQNLAVTVDDVNEAPTAVTLTTVTSSVAENTDASGGIIVASITITDDAIGTNDLTVVGTDAADFSIVGGNLVYTGADPNFELQSSYNVEVRVNDATIAGSSPVDSATFTLNITNVNDAPVAVDDFGAVNEGSLVTLNVLDGSLSGAVADSDEDGDAIVVTNVTDAPAGGNSAAVTGTPGTIITDLGAEVTLSDDGTLVYNATSTSAGFNALGVGDTAVDTFEYTIDDGNGGTDTGTVSITITGVNDAVIAVADTITASENDVDNPGDDADIEGDLLANDTDVDLGDVSSVVAAFSGVGATALASGTGFEITLDRGVVVNLNSDGTYSVDIPEWLTAGETISGTFSYTTQDEGGAQSTASVNVSVTGINDAASIAGTNIGTAVEDMSDASGVLVVTDVDTGEAEFIPATSTGTYGDFAINAAGNWTFVLDDANAAVQALPDGDTLTETFNVTSEDGTATETVTITIEGTNDVPVISGNAAGAVTEDMSGTVSAQITIADTDTGESSFQPIMAGSPGANGYGTFEVDASGNWTYTLNNAATDVQALGDGETLTDTILVTSFDNTATQTITVTINGTNDAPTISTGPLTEALVEGDFGLMADGTLDVADVDTTDIVSVSSALTGTSGTGAANVDAALTAMLAGFMSVDVGAVIDGVSTSGTINYDFNSGGEAFNFLATGETLILEYTITASDDSGTPASDSQTVTITITGTNDAAVIDGVLTGTVDEDNTAPSTDSGTATASDVDNADNEFVMDSGTTLYGSFTIDAAGAWVYTLDNTNADVDALNDTDSLMDSFTITSADGTTQTVNIMVAGTNDAAMIAGTLMGTADEDSGMITTGTATAADVDNTDNAFQITSGSTAYGTFSVDATGEWTYTLNESNPAVDALNDLDTLSDSFLVTSEDGTTETVSISITGTNDAAVIAGELTGTIDENVAAPSTVSGTATAADVDNTNDEFIIGSGTTFYGSFTIDAAGEWVYTLDDTNPAVDALNDTDTLPDSFTITSADGTTQTVSITITGTNDAAVIAGDLMGTVDEDSAVPSTVTGTATAADVDNTDNAFQVTSGTAAYGTFAVDASGEWTYTLNDSNPAVEALNDTDTLSDSFLVTSEDGTTELVSITITGTNDAAVIAGDLMGTVDEDSAVPSTVSGTATAADVDNADNEFVMDGDLTTYGSFTIDAAGAWVYTLDDANPAVDALNDTETLSDSFTITSADGTTETVSISITGSNDAPVAVADTAAAVEDGSLVTGSVAANDSDVDNGDTATYSLDAPVAGLTLLPDGSYSFDPTDGAYQTLASGATGTITANYTVTDTAGLTATSTLTITITGTNDAPIAVVDTVSALEGPGPFNGSVAANDSDVDDGAVLAFALTNGPIAGLTFNPDGSYEFDTDHPDYDALADGETVSIVAAYTVTDEFGATSSSTLTINLAGSNDAPEVAGVLVAAGDEDAAPFTVDMLSGATDVDTGATLSVVSGSITGLVDGVTFDALTNSLVVDPDADNFQYLFAGEDLDIVVTYDITDENGSTVSQSVTVTITGEDNSIFGDPGDNALIASDGDDDVFGEDGSDTLSYAGALGAVTVNLGLNGLEQDTGASGVDRLYEIENLIGSDFDDVLSGNDVDNVIDGGAGNDLILTFLGDDTVLGGDGNDRVNTGDGNDMIVGGAGRDRLDGGAGNDILDGGAANDLLIGADGNDRMGGGDFSDTMYGGNGRDIMAGQNGNDKMHGGGGNDVMLGGEGNDLINGGANGDRLYGGDNFDTIFGGTGIDLIDGGGSNDVLWGGTGFGPDGATDTFVFANTFGKDVIKDFEDGIDLIDFSEHTNFNSLADVLAFATDDGTNLTIALNGQNTLVIENFTVADLDASDFVF